ncbi:MAG TPA: type II secretion system F family protein [Fimbriimonadaceae bacterium]|nr:type II secretion system F family protein [Fimbriimonadaceae bacterium]
MPLYHYQATDTNGRPVSGTQEGAGVEQVAQELSARGLRLETVRVQEAAPPRSEAPQTSLPPPVDLTPRPTWKTDIAGPLVGRVPLENQLFFFRQLATMLGAGVNPVQSLDTLARQTRNGKLASIVHEAREVVLQGHPLSAALQRYPEVFTPLTISILRAGEEGGFTDSALSQIADYLEQEIRLRNLLRRVTLYPKITLVVSVVIIIGANMFIQMIKPNSSVSLSSPLTTWATWIVLLPLLVAAFLFVRVGLQNPQIRENWDLLILRLPGFGKTAHQFAMAKFGRAFGALYKAGLPIHKAFKLSADACGNQRLRAEMYPAFSRLEEGAGVTETMVSTGAFNPIVLDMVSTGETTGNLDFMLNKVAEFYEGEAETRSVQTGILFGVVVLLLVAIYVGYVYITNLVGIFSGAYQAAGE